MIYMTTHAKKRWKGEDGVTKLRTVPRTGPHRRVGPSEEGLGYVRVPGIDSDMTSEECKEGKRTPGPPPGYSVSD